MLRRIHRMIIKEFIQTFRDKRNWVFLFVIPVVQLAIIGYVVTTDVTNITTALYDLDNSAESRELSRRLRASGIFFITHTPRSHLEIAELLDKGIVLCAIQINDGFSRDLKKGLSADIQVIVDGTDSNTAMVANGYINKLLQKYSADMAVPAIAARQTGLDIRTRFWYNPDLKSRYFNVPGVIATIIMITCITLTATAIVREREKGTMEQLMVTPIRPIELMLGKTLPFALIGLMDMALVTVVGVLWFGVPIRGSLLLLLLGTCFYLMSILGIGLFISTISRTYQQAIMSIMFFNMPAILLSGFMFPIENMPDIFQYLTYLNPLRYFLIIIRGIFLKGTGFDVLWPQVGALLLIGVTIIMISSLRFRKRLG